MYTNPEVTANFLGHDYAFKYLLQGISVKNDRVVEKTLKVLTDIARIPPKVEDLGKERKKVLQLIGTKIALYWGLAGADDIDVQIAAVELMTELLDYTVNLSSMYSLSMKTLLFYMQPAYPNRLKTPLAKLIKRMVSNPVTLCSIDSHGLGAIKQEAYIRTDLPDKFLCEKCAKECGEQLLNSQSEIMPLGKETFVCNCRYCHMCMLQMPKPDRAKELFELRGLKIFVNMIVDPRTDLECVLYILETLVEMTDTDVTALVVNEDYRAKRFLFQSHLFSDICYKNFAMRHEDDHRDEIIGLTGSMTRVLDCLIWLLNPPSVIPSDTKKYKFSRYYPHRLRKYAVALPMISTMAMKCISNICKAIALGNGKIVRFENPLLVRFPGTKEVSVGAEEETDDDESAIAEKAKDTDTVMRNYISEGKLWHRRLLVQASKQSSTNPYSQFIVEKILGFMKALKESGDKESAMSQKVVLTKREVRGGEAWNQTLSKILYRDEGGNKVQIVSTPKYALKGNGSSEGWRIVFSNLKESPPGTRRLIFYTEYNIEGYNDDHVIIRGELQGDEEHQTAVDANGMTNEEFNASKVQQQLPLWEILPFSNIAKIDLGVTASPEDKAKYESLLHESVPTKLAPRDSNIFCKRPGTTIVKFVVAYVRRVKRKKSSFGKQKMKERSLPLPKHIRDILTADSNDEDPAQNDWTKSVLVGVSDFMTSKVYVHQPLHENLRRVRLRLRAKAKQMNAARCIIDTFSRGFSQTLRDSSSVQALLGCKLGSLTIMGSPDVYPYVTGLRVLVEQKRLKVLPVCIHADVALVQIAIHRKNNLLRHQVLDLLEGLNDYDSWVKDLNRLEPGESIQLDIRGNSISYFLARSLYSMVGKIVLFEETLAQRFTLLLSMTFLDLLDERFDEATRLMAIKTVGLLPMSPGGKCADCVVKSGLLKVLLQYQTFNASEKIVTEALAAAVGFAVHERFREEMIDAGGMKHFQQLIMGATSMVEGVHRVIDFANIGLILLNPNRPTSPPHVFKKTVLFAQLKKFVEWVQPGVRLVEDRWKAMGALVSFSKSFSTHHFFLEEEHLTLILKIAMTSSPDFSMFGSAPCQKEAVEILKNLSQNPLGIFLWMPFLEKDRLSWDYSGNFVPAIGRTKRAPDWIADVIDIEDGSSDSGGESDGEGKTKSVRCRTFQEYCGMVLGSYNVVFTQVQGVPLSPDYTISVWFRGGEWILKRPNKPNFFYTLVESTVGDKLIALDHNCHLGCMAAGKQKRGGLRHARWYNTGFDFSDASHTGEPFATNAAKNKWFHLLVIGQTVTHEGVSKDYTIFFVNRVVVKTMLYKCKSNIYCVGNTAHRSDLASHWDAISQFRVYNYAFSRSPMSWPAEIVTKPAVDQSSLMHYRRAVKPTDSPFYVLKTLSTNTSLINGLLHLLQSPLVTLNQLALQTLYNICCYPPSRILVAQNYRLLEVLDQFSRSTDDTLKDFARRVLIAVY
eukprot:g488.t1